MIFRVGAIHDGYVWNCSGSYLSLLSDREILYGLSRGCYTKQAPSSRHESFHNAEDEGGAESKDKRKQNLSDNFQEILVIALA